MVVTHMMISTTAYCWNFIGYNIVCSTSRTASYGVAQGGVDLVLWEWPPGRSLESTRFHGPNVVSCEVFRGTSRTPIIGSYLPPTMLDHLPNVEDTLEGFCGQYLILMRYLNVDLHESRNPLSHLFSDILAEFGLIDLMHNFWQRRCLRYLKAWKQVRQGTMPKTRCE